jgi:Flp pilus assembly pilin Flp
VTKRKGVSTLRHFRRHRDEGAAAVEFALLFPIFMILAMGIITVGTAFSRQINVTQAAREASRYGATLDISSISNTLCGNATLSSAQDRTDCWLKAVDKAATESVGKANNPIGGYNQLCVALVVTTDTGGVTSGSRHLDHGGVPTDGACGDTAPASIASTTYAQVVLLRTVQFFVIFINPTIHVDAVSTTPYERTVG